MPCFFRFEWEAGKRVKAAQPSAAQALSSTPMFLHAGVRHGLTPYCGSNRYVEGKCTEESRLLERGWHQRGEFARNFFKRLEPASGLEPLTLGLRNRCSTD